MSDVFNIGFKVKVMSSIGWLLLTVLLFTNLVFDQPVIQTNMLLPICGILSIGLFVYLCFTKKVILPVLPQVKSAPILRRRWMWVILFLFIFPTITSILLFAGGTVIKGMDYMVGMVPFISQWIILQIFLLFFGIRILVRFKRTITQTAILWGVSLGIIVLIGQMMRIRVESNHFEWFWGIFQMVTTMLLFIAGAILVKVNGLERINVSEENYITGFKNFLAGALLFLPLGILNAVEGTGHNFHWIVSVPQAVMYSWLPALAEEVWARFFLINLLLYFLKPLFGPNPKRGMAIIILFPTFSHALVHVNTLALFSPDGAQALLMIGLVLLKTGLIYLLPISCVFIYKGFEFAVGAHYIVNFVPFIVNVIKL